MTSPALAADDLDGFAAPWAALYDRSTAGSPFQSPDWLIPWWRAFQPGRLSLHGVSDAGRLVALAPCWLEDGVYGRRLLPLGLSMSDDTDVLIDPTARGADAALVAAVAADPDWGGWRLEDVLAGGAAAGLRPRPDWRAAHAPQNPRPVLPLGGPRDADGLPLTVPTDRRRKLRRALRLADARGGAVVARDPDAEVLIGELVRLHGLRWTERGEPGGTFADPRVRAFLAEALPRMQAAGLARTALLTVGGIVAGAYLGWHRGDRAMAYMGGFDPAFSHESPGAILMGDAIARAADEGAAWFDFLRGAEPYKYLWGATDSWTTRIEWRRR